MASSEIVFDASNPQEKRGVLTQIGALSGRVRLTITAYRPRRSDRQNAWYWPCIVQPFAQFLNDQQYEITTAEGEARSVATALAEYIDTEAIKLRHNRTACGCGTCSASRDANALLAKIVKRPIR